MFITKIRLGVLWFVCPCLAVEVKAALGDAPPRKQEQFGCDLRLLNNRMAQCSRMGVKETICALK